MSTGLDVQFGDVDGFVDIRLGQPNNDTKATAKDDPLVEAAVAGAMKDIFSPSSGKQVAEYVWNHSLPKDIKIRAAALPLLACAGGALTGAGVGAAINGATGAKAGAALGGAVGLAAGTVAGIEYVRLKVEALPDFQKWKETAKREKIFGEFQEIFNKEASFDEYCCGISFTVPVYPVRTPDGALFDLDEISNHMDSQQKKIDDHLKLIKEEKDQAKLKELNEELQRLRLRMHPEDKVHPETKQPITKDDLVYDPSVVIEVQQKLEEVLKKGLSEKIRDGVEKLSRTSKANAAALKEKIAADVAKEGSKYSPEVAGLFVKHTLEQLGTSPVASPRPGTPGVKDTPPPSLTGVFKDVSGEVVDAAANAARVARCLFK